MFELPIDNPLVMVHNDINMNNERMNMQEAYRPIHREPVKDITQWMRDSQEAKQELQAIQQAMIDTNFQPMKVSN